MSKKLHVTRDVHFVEALPYFVDSYQWKSLSELLSLPRIDSYLVFSNDMLPSSAPPVKNSTKHPNENLDTSDTVL